MQMDYALTDLLTDSGSTDRVVVVLDARGASTLQVTRHIQLFKQTALDLNQVRPVVCMCTAEPHWTVLVRQCERCAAREAVRRLLTLPSGTGKAIEWHHLANKLTMHPSTQAPAGHPLLSAGTE